MAKEKRSAADLDAELAALEAELAALEGKRKAPKAPKKAEAPKPAPQPEPAAAPAPEKKGRFSLPLPKKGRKAEPEPPAPIATVTPVDATPVAPEPVEAARSPAEATPPAPPPTLAAATYDLSLWRQDGDAWVRVVPDTPVPSMRRVLDEDGNVVREEPVAPREIESATAVKAERGLGRLLRRK